MEPWRELKSEAGWTMGGPGQTEKWPFLQDQKASANNRKCHDCGGLLRGLGTLFHCFSCSEPQFIPAIHGL